jgi:hypothetical protein
VVSGARTPASLDSLAALVPQAHEELLAGGRLLEDVERDE